VTHSLKRQLRWLVASSSGSGGCGGQARSITMASAAYAALKSFERPISSSSAPRNLGAAHQRPGGTASFREAPARRLAAAAAAAGGSVAQHRLSNGVAKWRLSWRENGGMAGGWLSAWRNGGRRRLAAARRRRLAQSVIIQSAWRAGVAASIWRRNGCESWRQRHQSGGNGNQSAAWRKIMKKHQRKAARKRRNE